MKMTLNVESDLIARASELTGVNELASLVRMGLEALIASRVVKRLAQLGGSEKWARAPRRRRSQ